MSASRSPEQGPREGGCRESGDRRGSGWAWGKLNERIARVQK